MITLWKSLARSRLEYCSQLWCPLKKGDIQNIEMVQRSYIRKISGMRDLSYWEQLNKLKMYSLERRRERYRIIYTWRILEGHVPNVGNNRITSREHERRGRECVPPSVKPSADRQVQNLIYSSLPVHGQKLFNALPRSLRNLSGCKVDTFKHELDKFLQTIPDEPRIRGYEQYSRTESNSLIDMIKSTYEPGGLNQYGRSSPTARCGSQPLP